MLPIFWLYNKESKSLHDSNTLMSCGRIRKFNESQCASTRKPYCFPHRDQFRIFCRQCLIRLNSVKLPVIVQQQQNGIKSLFYFNRHKEYSKCVFHHSYFCSRLYVPRRFPKWNIASSLHKSGSLFLSTTFLLFSQWHRCSLSEFLIKVDIKSS